MGVHTIHTSCNLGMNIHINQPNREVHLQGHMEFPCILHLPRSGTACHHVLHQTTPAKFDKEPTKSTKCIKLYQDTISTHNQQTGQLPDPISGGSIMKKKALQPLSGTCGRHKAQAVECPGWCKGMIRCVWKWGMHPIICHFIILNPWRDSSSTTNYLLGRPLTTRMWWNPSPKVRKLENTKIYRIFGYCGIFVESWTIFCIFFAAFLRSHSPPPSPSFRGFVAAKQCLQQRCHASGRTSHPDLTSGAHGIGFTELPRCSQQLDMANLSFGECGIGITTITICKKNRRARRPKGSLRPGANLCLNKLWNLAGSMIFLFATTQLKFKVVQSPGLIIHTKSAWLFTILWHVGPNMRRRTGEWWQSGTVWICIYIYI